MPSSSRDAGGGERMVMRQTDTAFGPRQMTGAFFAPEAPLSGGEEKGSPTGDRCGDCPASPWWDAHVHLDRYSDPKAVLARARAAGVAFLLAVATDAASCRRLLALKRRFPGRVGIAFGLHPERKIWNRDEVESVLELLEAHADEVDAVGEVGLPHYILPETERARPPWEAVEVLDAFLDAAVRLGKPVLLHAVYHGASIALERLRRAGVARAHFHWLKAEPDVLARILSEGYFVSVTPDVLVRARDRDLVRRVPLAQLLLETDGPWPFDGQPAEPAWIPRVGAAVAALLGLDEAAVRRTVWENGRRLLNGRI